MFGDIAIVPISIMLIGAGFFFLMATLVGLITEPFIKDRCIG